MSKIKYLQFIASFLIVLVLTIPFYTTSVYATINKISVKGSNGIEGFARANDFLQFNVQASISDEEITNNQVIIGPVSSGIKFDKCVKSINNGSECTLRFPTSGTESFEPKPIPFTINLVKDDGTLDDSKSDSVVIDDKAPQVKLTTTKNKFSSQQDVVINYKVTDFACDDESCIDKCVGIKNIEFFTLDGSFNENIDVTSSECSLESEIAIDPKKFNDGKNSVFAKATDKFNQVSQETSVSFDVDTSGPVIIPNSFAIMRKGTSLSTFSPNKVPVEVTVNISASDLNLNSVTSDLSALNPSGNLKNAKASCSSVQDNLSICKWSIDLNPLTSGSKNIVISASDNSGNNESTTISKNLAIDNKGPVVQSLSTLTTKGNQVLGKATGNTVIAVFDEATGLSPDDVILHVNKNSIKATSCSKETNWACVWNNINFGSNTKISIEKDTIDILGNAVSQNKIVEVTVDDKVPVLRSLNISPVGGLNQAFTGFFKVGDKIAVVANLTEENELFAVADFSRFISEANNVSGTCEKINEDTHLCAWLTDTINLQNADVITFNFTDSAGNSLIFTKSFKTFGLSNETTPDFWTNTVTCSPKTLDRQLGPLINQRVFCQVKLKPKSSSKPALTVFIGPASCTGDTSIVDSVDTFNTEVGSTSPVIKITLKKDDLKVDNASLSCSLDIFSKVGSSITGTPEIENAKINLGFFNLPLGELSDEVQRKIKDAKDEANGIWKLIGTLNKLVNIAKKICQLINTMYNVVAVLYLAYFVIKGAEFTCDSTIVLFPTICNSIYGMAVGQCKGTEAANEGADFVKKASNKFCDIVTCKQTFLWGNDMRKFVNDIPFPVSPGQYLGPKTDSKYSSFDYVREVSIGRGGQPRPVSEYMDPQHNLIVATLFVCLPGIIYGLDKYRQVKCLYADCLQNAVGKDGIPVTACEDQKAYATCKYVTGELFAVFPWTAVFDHFMVIVRNALSNPFATLGVAIALACPSACPVRDDLGLTYKVCRGFRLLSLVGDAAQNVANIINEGFTIRQDYCSRLK